MKPQTASSSDSAHFPPSVPRTVLLRFGVGLCAAALSACGGGSGSTPIAVLPDAPIATSTPQIDAQKGAALEASLPGDLLDYFKDKLKKSAANPIDRSQVVAFSTTASPSPVSEQSGGVFSSTNVQEGGVDENDWLKTDGQTVYALAKGHAKNGAAEPAQLQAQKVQPDGQLAPLAALSLPSDVNYAGMYLLSSANRVAVLSQKFSAYVGLPMPLIDMPAISAVSPAVIGAPSLLPAPGQQSRTIGIDLLPLATGVSASATWSINQRIRMDGSLVGSRVIGSTLYVVSNHQPSLATFAIPANSSAAQASALLAKLTAKELIPTITIDNRAPEPLMLETDCYVQPANASQDAQITTITAFDLGSATLQRSSRCFVGGSQALYVSPAAVYIATSRFSNAPTILPNTVMAPNSTTDIHKFSLSGQAIAYRGSGAVQGHLGWDADKVAYRMSEYQGDLRVLSFTGQEGWSFNRNGSSTVATPMPSPSPATLTVLREAAGGGALQAVATLPNAQQPAPLGKPGEQIYAVQYAGARAYLVTFKRTDPLYVIDLANPREPRILGELALPGYSDYLYPMGDSLLLGVGKDANEDGVVGGVKLALIDVANPAQPSVRSSVVLGQRGSASALDTSSRGINIFEQGGVFRVALPVRLSETPTRSLGSFVPTSQALARFEVNTSAKTLTTKPSVLGLTYTADNFILAYGEYDLAQERSVQIGASVYYFSGGKLLASRW